MPDHRRKLIEVALPLDAINRESAREKSIRRGHPSTLHLWWARRPLAACRAVLFSSLVNDPDDDPMYGVDQGVAASERAKLFDLIEELVKWENSYDPNVVNRARLEIARSLAADKVADGELDDDTPLVVNAPELPAERARRLPDAPKEYTARDVRFKVTGLGPEQVNHFLTHYGPPVVDPFAGGGSIPLEAQRLGLRAYACDLNPVAVLINKALIEIPPKFANLPPVNPQARQRKQKNLTWRGAQGLAEDVRYYGKWMRDEAQKRIGHLYPQVRVTSEMVADRPDLRQFVGQNLTVMAWIWTRTVKSPNPAARGKHVPLVRSFWLSRKKRREVYVVPEIDGGKGSYTFRIKVGTPEPGCDPHHGTVDRSGGRCLLTDSVIPFDWIRNEGSSGNLSQRLLAMVAVAGKNKVYLPATDEQEEAASNVILNGHPETNLPDKALGFRVQRYGMDKHYKLFSKRQLLALQTMCDIACELDEHVSKVADVTTEYCVALRVYLSFAISRFADYWSSLNRWQPANQQLSNTFGRQSLSMVWDFAEANPFSGRGGSFDNLFEWTTQSIKLLETLPPGIAIQGDAMRSLPVEQEAVYSTDPPYYDNIGYADLSDFFYIWLRRILKRDWPSLFSTLLTPKAPELIASPFRHGDSITRAKTFFEDGLRNVFQQAKGVISSSYPITVYYAFKQVESAGKEGKTASTGWETMLEGLMRAGFHITGTWPLRTEMSHRMRGIGANALASSVVLACRPRPADALTVTRRDFASALRRKLPEAIKHLQLGNVAPVDLAQAAIGPGMAVFSRYQKVVNADGSRMSVRQALQLINKVLDEALVEQETDYDAGTRFAIRWFEQYGMQEGPFGDAETLAKAMAVAIGGSVKMRIAKSRAGKLRLLRREELDLDGYSHANHSRTMWEVTQHLIRTLEQDGEQAAGDLLQQFGAAAGETACELAYRLYQTCERAKLADEARAYNTLVVSWPEIVRLSRLAPKTTKQVTVHDKWPSDGN